jgi:bifunctional non-homologous end joining protein LigD
MTLRPIRPMMAVSAATLPIGDDWSYEVKWDGYRAQAMKRGAVVSLASRNLKDFTSQFPGIAEAAARVRAHDALIDGEIVALDASGRPSFQGLHHWAMAGLTVVFYAFDLLHLDGRELSRLPLDERRALLKQVVGQSGLLLSEPLPGTAAQIGSAIRRLRLEGVVAKKRRSVYEAGKRSDAWVKVRFARRQELVIGGFKPNASDFDSILVGYYEGRTLLCAGKVRSGFTPRARAIVFGRLEPLQIRQCPFANLPASRASHWGMGVTADEMAALRWVKPLTVAEVSFTEWTRDGSLRHAAFVALRDDKPPRQVTREVTGSRARA